MISIKMQHNKNRKRLKSLTEARFGIRISADTAREFTVGKMGILLKGF
jgi:hypothetical protein